MASHVDSVATFRARVEDIGLGELWDKMAAMKINTYAAYAFGANFTPGSPDETPFIEGIVKPSAGEDKSLYSGLRRLFFESYTLMAAETKRRL